MITLFQDDEYAAGDAANCLNDRLLVIRLHQRAGGTGVKRMGNAFRGRERRQDDDARVGEFA